MILAIAIILVVVLTSSMLLLAMTERDERALGDEISNSSPSDITAQLSEGKR